MEEKARKQTGNERLDTIEKHISRIDTTLDKMNDKIDRNNDRIIEVDDKHDEKNTDLRVIVTRLETSSMATEKNTERMANSIEGLVGELRQANTKTDTRFSEVNSKLGSLEGKIDDKNLMITTDLEKEKISNTLLVAIIGSVGLVIQVIIQFIVPLFF